MKEKTLSNGVGISKVREVIQKVMGEDRERIERGSCVEDPNRKFREMRPAFIEGTLSDVKTKKFIDHIGQCVGCYDEVAFSILKTKRPAESNSQRREPRRRNSWHDGEMRID